VHEAASTRGYQYAMVGFDRLPPTHAETQRRLQVLRELAHENGGRIPSERTRGGCVDGVRVSAWANAWSVGGLTPAERDEMKAIGAIRELPVRDADVLGAAIILTSMRALTR
jgi:hypothetical protein